MQVAKDATDTSCVPIHQEHQGLDCGPPAVSPVLTQDVQQHLQGLPAQPEIRVCILFIKKPVQDRDAYVDPAVQGPWLVEGKVEKKGVPAGRYR